MDAKLNDTRTRVLEAACAAFAEKGFRDATVAETCRAAKANIAAVNYHFGSKESLYVEAWRHSHRAMLAASPPDGGVQPDAPAAERLRGRIRALVLAAVGAEDTAFRIMSHEMANPTGLLKQVFRESIRPLRQLTEGIVGELLGEAADEQAVRLCTTCVTAPCLHLLRVRHVHRHLKRNGRSNEDVSKEMEEYLTTFALAGIEAVRRKLSPAKASAGVQGGE